MKYYLAVDIGASSGRHMLGHVESGKMILEEIFRFDNGFVEGENGIYWDTEKLFSNILEGMKCCKTLGKIPFSIGIDTWGVDYVLLDENDKPIGDAMAYRDNRTDGMEKLVETVISNDELYEITGLQRQPYNTIYQFMADRETPSRNFSKAHDFLMIPEYFNFLLTGEKVHEYSICSTTGLINANTKKWDLNLIEKLSLNPNLFKKNPQMPGISIGKLSEKIADIVGFNCTVSLPCMHDTGSAYLAVPAANDTSVYISSGTWSVLGVENKEAITTKESAAANFANEGGYDGRFRYLKNIMGLWMIQSIRRNLDKKYSFAELEKLAQEADYFKSVIDVDDLSFLDPPNMIDAVSAYCQKTQQDVPTSIGETMQCVYQSLAKCYKKAIDGLQKITKKTYTHINIVGGGSKDGYLNALTARYTGLPVIAGPTEGTAIGNLMAQFILTGEFDGIVDARASIKEGFPIKEYKL